MFERQGLHVLILIGLAAAAVGFAPMASDGFGTGSALGLGTGVWFVIALTAPVAHQVWVWLCWRLELHHGWMSHRFGHPAGFRIYAGGFAALAFTRVGSAWVLGIADHGSIGLLLGEQVAGAAVCLGMFGWLIQSVVKIDDTTSGIGEAMNAGCWGVGVARYSNYMDVDTAEQGANLSDDEVSWRIEKTREILRHAGAHYVIDSLVDIEPVIEDINRRLANGEKP